MAGVAMPAAAKLMADNNMAAGSVAGTGKDGRVTKGDVLVAASAPVAKPAAAQVAAPAPVVAAPIGILHNLPSRNTLSLSASTIAGILLLGEILKKSGWN